MSAAVNCVHRLAPASFTRKMPGKLLVCAPKWFDNVGRHIDPSKPFIFIDTMALASLWCWRAFPQVLP
jgi:hypothetical protein